TLPQWLENDLRLFLHNFDYPLSVRSSSLLEDAQFRPYAGLYNTFMLMNDHEDFEIRFDQLVRSVKLVYASTWFADPRAFSRSIGQLRKDSMAVIIQQLVGGRYGDYFYPSLSGVAQSFNYYPIAPMQAGDGIAHIALGFGRAVVEGEQSLRFSPGFPENLPQFSTVEDILQNAQRWFYSLDCSRAASFVEEQSNLVRRDIESAITDYPVRLLTSTYFPEEHRIRDADLVGHKVLTFAPVLKYEVYPLAQVLSNLLAFSKEGMGCEVEVEFSLDLHENPKKSTFYFLQVRPIVTGSEAKILHIEDGERKSSFLRSLRALGHGLYQEMCDIVYVDPERFNAARNKEIARQVGGLNKDLHKEGRPYLLIGPGRWGTADPWLGIPVQWRDISGVGAIVELQGGSLRVEASQGTHFFQNITSLGVPYLMVDDSGNDSGKELFPEMINWQYLKSLPIVRETEYVKHVRLEKAFSLKANGRFSEAVVFP
ncbi:MAG: PEP/pyruvate-binding domain-containing protein, partial [Desulfobulbaceae bacterium]|nr:PEP/pyruvate-binding domain-containing protein [Desulfobulbaceae bacterium]